VNNLARSRSRIARICTNRNHNMCGDFSTARIRDYYHIPNGGDSSPCSPNGFLPGMCRHISRPLSGANRSGTSGTRQNDRMGPIRGKMRVFTRSDFFLFFYFPPRIASRAECAKRILRDNKRFHCSLPTRGQGTFCMRFAPCRRFLILSSVNCILSARRKVQRAPEC